MIAEIRQNNNLFIHTVLSIMGVRDKTDNSTGKFQNILIPKLGSH